MNEKLCFFDILNQGHHFFYNSNLMKELSKEYNITYYTAGLSKENKMLLEKYNIECEIIKYSRKENFICEFFQIIKILMNFVFFISSKKINKVLFMYYDQIIIQSILLIFIKCEKILVLHWMPNKLIKRLLMKLILLFQESTTLIVHNDIIKFNLIKSKLIKHSQIKVIDYPIRETDINKCTNIKEKLNIDNEYPIILAFGGTRYDKGLDILLESCSKIKYPFNLVVAGREEYFKRDFIEKNFDKSRGNKIILNLGFIDDHEMNNYFFSSDIIVIPYRKIFMGESGPLSEGIKFGKPVVASNWYIIGDVVKEYNAGEVFEPENSSDLANKINMIIENIDRYKDKSHKASIKFIQKHSLSNFTKQYKNLIG